MEKTRVPFLFYMVCVCVLCIDVLLCSEDIKIKKQIFLDCTAPKEFFSLLNCMTVDFSTSNSLLQSSLHLVAKGMGFFPHRIVDYMRIHRVLPKAEGSFKALLDAMQEEVATTTSKGVVQCDGSLGGFTSFNNKMNNSNNTNRDLMLNKNNEINNKDIPDNSDSDDTKDCRGTETRNTFNITSNKFLQIFASAHNETDAADMYGSSSFVSNLHCSDSDRRYRKAVSTKGHEVYALMDSGRKRKGSRRHSKSNKEMTVVDLYMAETQLQKKEKADQRLREYVYDKTAQQRKSSGLAAAHARLLRMREEATCDSGANQITAGKRLSQVSNQSDTRKKSFCAKKKKDRKRKPPTKHDHLTSSFSFNETCDSSSSESSDNDDLKLPNRHQFNTAIAMHSAHAKKREQQQFRKMVRRGSQIANSQPTSQDGDGDDGSDSDHNNLTDSVHNSKVPSLGTTRSQSGTPGVPRYYAYEGDRAGGLKPLIRTCDFLQRDYRSLGNGIRVDWRLGKDKQSELRTMLKQQTSIHAGPPIEVKSKGDIQEEIRRVSSIASANSKASFSSVSGALREGRQPTRPTTARTHAKRNFPRPVPTRPHTAKTTRVSFSC